jgi:hypothetical protein
VDPNHGLATCSSKQQTTRRTSPWGFHDDFQRPGERSSIGDGCHSNPVVKSRRGKSLKSVLKSIQMREVVRRDAKTKQRPARLGVTILPPGSPTPSNRPFTFNEDERIGVPFTWTMPITIRLPAVRLCVLPRAVCTLSRRPIPETMQCYRNWAFVFIAQIDALPLIHGYPKYGAYD